MQVQKPKCNKTIEILIMQESLKLKYLKYSKIAELVEMNMYCRQKIWKCDKKMKIIKKHIYVGNPKGSKWQKYKKMPESLNLCFKMIKST